MSIVTQMSKKGQILVPKAIRRHKGLVPGSKIQLVETDQGVLIKPAPKDPIAAACGFLKGGPSLTKELLDERRREREREEALFERRHRF